MNLEPYLTYAKAIKVDVGKRDIIWGETEDGEGLQYHFDLTTQSGATIRYCGQIKDVRMYKPTRKPASDSLPNYTPPYQENQVVLINTTEKYFPNIIEAIRYINLNIE